MQDIKQAESRFCQIDFSHVPRSMNDLAHDLEKEAMTKHKERCLPNEALWSAEREVEIIWAREPNYFVLGKKIMKERNNEMFRLLFWKAPLLT